eukprot:3485793-Rhodomonas_salina.1
MVCERRVRMPLATRIAMLQAKGSACDGREGAVEGSEGADGAGEGGVQVVKRLLLLHMLPNLLAIAFLLSDGHSREALVVSSWYPIPPSCQ